MYRILHPSTSHSNRRSVYPLDERIEVQENEKVRVRPEYFTTVIGYEVSGAKMAIGSVSVAYMARSSVSSHVAPRSVCFIAVQLCASYRSVIRLRLRTCVRLIQVCPQGG